ncbi:MAG: M42 family metallopeptidase [Planctomycetia bacterium]|jgi:endoglucanase|nr:M42 family metallopeptidase [Planctomycetia bacterium]MBL6915129.1 M42 family metallopeptidase [Planctomycetota bacterium]NCG57176.1 M20/M25/M40 family metallo-hydrolase [Pseudomonadota bacterium]MDA9264980.1 M42 family metallopeptidase [Planctomycetota bacterium]MDG2083558.1 M42 family metallopeptidase [Planctomycetota bacterium]
MELLKELCEAHGAPGFEDRIRAIFRREIEAYVDRIEVDGIGNCIAIKEGKPGSPKVMLAGHLDEIGFVVKHIDDRGFLRLSPLGGFDPKTLIAKRVTVNTSNGEEITGMIGSKPIHIMTPEDRKKMPTVPELFVDVSLTKEEAQSRIEIGDPVTLKQSFEVNGSRCSGKSLDNRVSIYTLIEAVKRYSNDNVSVYAVATTQEEVGLRGAMTASHRIEPDCGIAIDVTLACDIPGATEHERISALGAGVAIKIHDSSSISNPKMVRAMRNIAREQDIPFQMEILTAGGTDAGGIQRGGSAVPAITLSVPCRYVHTVVETIDSGDLEATVALLANFLNQAHEIDLGYDS